MKSNFVFDTNTLISAALSPLSTNASAMRKAEISGPLVCSDDTWSEFLNVLFRAKFDKYFTISQREEIAERFAARLKNIKVNIVISECRDRKDNMFLELAVTSNAVCVVSGDPDLIILNPFRNIPIVNARSFLDSF